MNCIEADNEIHLVPERLHILEEKVLKLENFFFIQPGEYSINTKSCPRCHPTFDEDGIL